MVGSWEVAESGACDNVSLHQRFLRDGISISRQTGKSSKKVSRRRKSDKEIMREIQAIMRQIASSITYLPCLDEPCMFDVLAYTDKDVAVPFTWIESDAKLIQNPQMVKLHSFDTKIHKVDTLVSYKNDEWDEV
ncbi:Mitotic spindle checkpoint protein MAD2 [Acorus calamus]|uniref:Mitotic spindle checkpoint protein MAD2 n=1 Tax=Acorus calamus TaxID=4465 RepID=A0AAV9CQH6_ACOCL|nr:Mitotic spindle checkpoint protein MAD2 [Acorus calamus]